MPLLSNPASLFKYRMDKHLTTRPSRVQLMSPLSNKSVEREGGKSSANWQH